MLIQSGARIAFVRHAEFSLILGLNCLIAKMGLVYRVAIRVVQTDTVGNGIWTLFQAYRQVDVLADGKMVDVWSGLEVLLMAGIGSEINTMRDSWYD